MINNLKKLAIAATIVAGFGFSASDAMATYSCTNTLYGSSGTYAGLYTSSSCDANNTTNTASTVSTSSAVLKTAASQTAKLVGNRVSAALGGGNAFNVASNGFSASTGMAAGNHAGKIGAWVSGTWSNVEDNNNSTAFDGDVYSTMVGVDYRVAPKTIVGISIGYENVEIDTEYNGFNGQDGNLDGDGYTIAPYIGVQLTEKVTANLTAGYSDVEYDTTRYDQQTGNRIDGSTDADRYFVDASVSGSHIFDEQWRLHGKASIFYASEDKDAFTETESNGQTIANGSDDNEFGQFGLDARLGYLYKHVEPYALAAIEYDFAKDEGAVATGQSKASLDDEDFGAKFGAGLNFQLAPNVSGSFEGYTVEFRDDYEEYTFTGGLRVKF